MRKMFVLPALLAGLLAGSALSQGQPPMAIHDGDRVVFYGDSITAQRFYTRFVEDFVLTRYPQMQVSFWNAGVPGDTVSGGYTGNRDVRLKRDLFPHRPTVVTVMLGMNDGYYMPFNQKYLDIFEEGYRNLLGTIAANDPEARITLISTTPYDEVTHGTEFAGYNDVVSRHAAFAKDLAASRHEPFADFNKIVTDLEYAGKQSNAKLAAMLVQDHIHPSESAHWALAAELARSWGLSPVVSSVRVDAAQAKVTATERTAITDLAVKDGQVRWTQKDEALPLPLELHDGMIQFVLEIGNLASMDRQMMRVEGLTAARYTLKIDGHAVGTFKREELAAGVNLALYPTPMQGQAKGVDGLEQKRARLNEASFILGIEEPKAAGSDDAVKAIEAKDAALAEEQRKEAQPKPHAFELLVE